MLKRAKLSVSWPQNSNVHSNATNQPRIANDSSNDCIGEHYIVYADICQHFIFKGTFSRSKVIQVQIMKNLA